MSLDLRLSLDLRTIAALTSLSALLVGLAMFAAARSFGGQGLGIRRWAWGCLTMSLGWAFIAETGHVPAFFSVVSANSLLVASLALYLHAFREFVGVKTRPLATALPYGVAALVFLLFLRFTYAAPNLAARVVVISVAAAPLQFACTATLLRGRGTWPFSHWLIGIGLGVSGLANLARAAFVLLYGNTASSALTPNGQQTVTFLFVYGTVILLTFGFALMCSDKFITELRHLAMSDSVTGSLSRTGLEALAQKEMARAARTRAPLSLLMLDLDHFKAVNDVHGHLVGDSVLRGLVATAREDLRAYDLFGRFGGEEFVALLPDTGPEEARRIAERMRGRVGGHALAAERETLRCTVSIGLATLNPDGEDFASLLGRADAALYRAKSEGRNRVEEAPAASAEPLALVMPDAKAAS